MLVKEVRTKEEVDDVVVMARIFHAENAPHLDFSPDCIHRYADAIRYDFDRTSYNAFIAYNDSQEPVGFLVAKAGPYFFSDQIAAYQELWYVIPGLRGTRVAFELIKMFEEWARLLGAVEIFTGQIIPDPVKGKKVSRVLTKLGYPRVGSYHKMITIGV